MSKIFKIVLGMIVIILAGYSLISQNFILMPYMMLFLGLFMLVIGISEFQKNQRINGFITVLASLFVLFVFIYTV